jgi:hypothetical protein
VSSFDMVELLVLGGLRLRSDSPAQHRAVIAPLGLDQPTPHGWRAVASGYPNGVAASIDPRAPLVCTEISSHPAKRGPAPSRQRATGHDPKEQPAVAWPLQVEEPRSDRLAMADADLPSLSYAHLVGDSTGPAWRG